MLSRRVFLASAVVAATVPRAAHAQEMLAADEAHRRAAGGEIVLIDVRSPEEWKTTGVAERAQTIWIRDPKLGQKLDSVTGSDRSKPVALICATGVRSGIVAAAMARAGYSTIYNVGEGMHGSAAGPGWLRRGLPVVKAN